MNTQEVATRLVQLCREGKNADAINELYDENIISKEPKGSHAELSEGKDAVIAKTQQWVEMVEEVHSAQISDPVISGNFFSCSMDMDVTYKNAGRNEMNEICVYEVRDGKIVAEEFFYTIPA